MKKNKEHKKDAKITKLEKLVQLEGLTHVIKNEDLDKALAFMNYEEELEKLQIELVKLQRDIQKNNRRVVVIFEGRDAAGKGGAIRRFTHHLNPRSMRVVALPKPTEIEKGQMYFQRYVNQLPNPGEIVFFDRSWYNRAVVEPVNKFCSEEEYKLFMNQVLTFEKMLIDSGVEIIKLWFSIDKKEQLLRFTQRKTNPLKQWKISEVDEKAQKLWDKYTKYKKVMFAKTHSKLSPWVIINGNVKYRARLESIRYVLHKLKYEGKGQKGLSLVPDPRTVKLYKK